MSIFKRRNEIALLTYCTNVHPTESPGELLAALQRYTLPLKKRLTPEFPMAVGLRLGAAGVDELTRDRKQADAFASFLRGSGLKPFTLNAFPYGDFHADRVKEAVFEPTWLDEQRVIYTARAARWLASLIAEGETATISTHTGAYRARGTDDEMKGEILENLIRVVASLHTLRTETDRTILLCLEPEPFSTLEDTAEVIEFFRKFVFGQGPGLLADERGLDARTAEEAVFTHLGVCFDTCHLAVQGEDLQESARLYRTEGIRVGKVQISAALEVRGPGENPEAVEALRRFGEDRYLHQVVAHTTDGEKLRLPDLDDLFALSDEERQPWLDADLWRVHYHVPLTWSDIPPLATTHEQVSAVLPLLLEEGICQNLEIETYTWGVLPGTGGAGEGAGGGKGGGKGRGKGGGDGEERNLVDDIEAEFRWVGAILRSAGWMPV